MGHKNGKLLYHLTSLTNLESILANNLICRNNLQIKIDDVADHDILIKRNEKFKLGNYVPFHFFMSNPFDGSVFLDSKNIGKEFVYICVKREYAKLHNWKIIPRHPLNENSIEIMNYDDGINNIQWDLIDAEDRDYNVLEVKESCMAECIANGKVETSAIFLIKCPSTTVKHKVDKILDDKDLSSIHTDITHFTNVYYNGRIND